MFRDSSLTDLLRGLIDSTKGQLAARLLDLLPLGPPRLRVVRLEFAAGDAAKTVDAGRVQSVQLLRTSSPGQLLQLGGDGAGVPLLPGVRARGPFEALTVARRNAPTLGIASSGAFTAELLLEEGTARFDPSPFGAGAILDYNVEQFGSGAAYSAPTGVEGVRCDGANRVGIWLLCNTGGATITGAAAGRWWFLDPITGIWGQSSVQDTPETGQRAWAAAGMRLDTPGGRCCYRPGANTASAGTFSLLTIASE